LLLLSKELEKEKISDLIIHKLSDILLYDILENWISKQITNEPGWVKVFEDELILNAIQILHSNLKIPWNMEKFSLEIKISKNELVQRFLNSLGIRPMEYLNYIRIEKGKSLLLKSSLGLEEIAKETGFLNKNAFSRAYKKKTGISPSKVRSGKL
ncbi:MAG: helix-turn-helix transcriptional regulator, partial [Leptospiraceae bacterium]|nr:helix-turn-helix transcriptional regulator [Leptospiraceae bacterium]